MASICFSLIISDMPVGHLYVFFEEMSIWIFCPFLDVLFFILSHISCLCVLDINPLSVISFVNIFSFSVACLFIYGFLCCAKAFKFDVVPCSLFFLLFILNWKTHLRKYCHNLCQRKFYPCSFLEI